MKIKLQLLLCFLLALTTASMAQSKGSFAISGTISSDSGEPLVGASVVQKGTTNGATTDIDGKFSLNVPDGKTTLVVSYVGYNSKDVAVNNQNTINVSLSEGGALNEVVVVGYGTQKKSQTTGAISSINSRQLTEMPITSLGQALQGRVAGVDVAQSGSKPGTVPTIRVRGRRSFRASNDPLYVVDGIPLADGYEDFNPNDVQSMEILKDATATAIYGARGANGVILITTKRSTTKKATGRTTVTYDNYFGQSEAYKTLTLFTGDEFAEYVRESRRGATSGYLYKDAAGNPVPTGVKDDFADSKIDVFDPVVLQGIKEGRNTQYQDWLLRQGTIQNHTLGVQGGNEKTSFYISAGYFKDNGISVGLDYSRMSIRANIDHQINDRFKAGISTYGMLSIRNGEGLNPYSFTLQQNPLGAAFDKDGLPIFAQTNDALLTNPLFEIVPGAQIDEARRFRIFNSIYAEAKIMDGLTYRVNFGPDATIQRRGRFIGSMTNAKKGGNNEAIVDNRFGFHWVLENILNYDKKIGKHTIGTTALHSIQRFRFETYSAAAQGVPVEKQSFYRLDGASLPLPASSNLIPSVINSYMVRVNYDYDNKYLLTATIRRDGSSVFGENYKYGNFPGIALGWNMHNESFMKGTGKWLDVLKLRASWGQVGNQAVSPFQTQGLLERTVYAYGTSAAFGYRPGSIGNNDLRWESSTTKNIGIDFSILSGRVYGSLELYRVNTTDLLLADQLPNSTGFNAVTRNVGETQNQGFEATLTTVNVDKGGFKWTSDIAFTKNNEQIISLYNGKVDDLGNRWFIGKPLSAFYDYTKDGIWQLGEEDKAKSYGSRVGQVKVTDADGDGKITPLDRRFIGSEIPDWSGSITNRFSYGGFDLSIMIYARIGQTILSGFHRDNNQLAGRYQQIKVDYWTPKNPTNEFPQPNKDQEFPVFNQTLIYFDGSFVKIRNINFGYTLPSSLTKKLGIESLRLFSSIQQPKIWAEYMTKYNGIDPEVNEARNPDRNLTPATKVFTAGLNVQF
jgi:TonB-linked SusC/RagA family outer membrane protein